MSLTDRDRKIILMLVPLAVIAAYWFLLLAPKRQESTTVQEQLTQAQSERDTAVQKLAALSKAKNSFATDYASVIYLGKSVPSTVDMPSLLVQLDRAARGTGIKFTSIQTGDRATAPASTSTSTPPGGSGGPGNSSAPAQSGPGQTAQNATNGVNNANAANGASAAAAGSPTGSATAAASGSGAPGLDSVPLDFEFDGNFFALADFFHRMKRFVRVANDKIIVRGRLLTINSFSFDTQNTFPSLKATVHATVYLAPKTEGVSAGATPQGPAGSGQPGAASGSQTASTSSTPPAATVTAP